MIYCFACGNHTDAIGLVQIQENMTFKEALKFLWTDILGRSLPDYMEHKKRPVSFNDLSFIGLTGAQGRYIWMYINRTDDVNVPPGYYIDYKSKEDGEYNVYQKERADSFFELMDTDLPTAKTLAINKCIETRSYYYGMLKMLDDPKTDLGESAKNPEFKHEATVFLNSQIQKVNRISKKIKSL